MKVTNMVIGGLVAAALMASVPAVAQTAKAEMKDAKGVSVGTIDLTETSEGVLLTVSLKGVPSGVHGFHIHAVGKCEGADFATAGGHFNPASHKHGLMSPQGRHAGDLPNLHIPASGDLKADVLAANVTLKAGQANSLFDQDGSAVVIHDKADDYKTDPAGDAGPRIACGVISP